MKRNPITRHRLYLSSLHELSASSSEEALSDGRPQLVSQSDSCRPLTSHEGEPRQMTAIVRDELVEIHIPSLRNRIQRERATQGVYDVREVLGSDLHWQVTLHGAVSPCFLGVLCNCRDVVREAGREFRILLTEGVKEMSDASLWLLIEHFHVEYEN